jgi:hypothetical protein
VDDFPSMKARRLLAILMREPLNRGRIERSARRDDHGFSSRSTTVKPSGRTRSETSSAGRWVLKPERARELL